MAIAAAGRVVTMTAVNEGISFPPLMPRKLLALSFQGGASGGSALTATQRLVVRDSGTVGSGNIIADYLIEGTADNADLWGGRPPQLVNGLSIDNNTVGGTWVLTATFEA